MGKRRIFSRVCLMVVLCFVFTLCQAILPKPVRGVSIAPQAVKRQVHPARALLRRRKKVKRPQKSLPKQSCPVSNP